MQDEQSDMSNVIRLHATRHAPPPELRAQIEAHIEREQLAAIPIRQNAPTRLRPLAWWNLVGAFAAGALATVLLTPTLPYQTASAVNAGELVDSHIRAMQPGHLMDVISTDQHTVKPWFAGKLDYTPPVRDFAADGFPLTGGRLDAINGHTVAALVYRHRQHLINVYLAPKDVMKIHAGSGSERGFNYVELGGSGMNYLFVSDLNAEELASFANRVQNEKD